MSDHDDADAETGPHADHDDPSDRHEGRVTSPMQEFESSQVTIGFVVLVVGLVVTFGVPLLL